MASEFSRYSLENRLREDHSQKLLIGEQSILKITEDSSDMKLSGLSDIQSPVGQVIPDIINTIPFPQTNQYHSSLDELPHAYKKVSKDAFPPSLSSTISGLDFIPTKNVQLDSIGPELPTRIRRSSTPSVFNTLSVDSATKKDSPGINGNVSPIEVFPRVTPKKNPISQGEKTDLTPDLGFPELDIGDLGEISTLHINLRGQGSSDEIRCTKTPKLAPIEKKDPGQFMGSVYDETGEKIDL